MSPPEDTSPPEEPTSTGKEDSVKITSSSSMQGRSNERQMDQQDNDEDDENPTVAAAERPKKEEALQALRQFHKSLRIMDTSAATADTLDASLPSSPKNKLSFENMTVLVPESGWKTCSCLNSPIRHYASDYLGVAVERTEAFWAMEGISGHVAGGELLLVLSSNALAASTLMRALTGRLSRTRDQMSGSLLWNGIPLHENDFQPWRRAAPYVSSRDDSHAAVLTVRETLQFAAECVAGDETPVSASQDRVDRLMTALGIDHVADTVVGDENLRGISGGQKRRVTVGEMLLNPQAKLLGLENITDGLASTDSYNLIQMLANAAKVLDIAAVISLLQPSDEIVALFDKLLVMTDEGKLAYFGPPDRDVLRHVFLGDSSKVERDTGSICDLVLGNVSDSKQCAEITGRFYTTDAYQGMISELAEIRSQAARENRNIHEQLPSKGYSCSSTHQMAILARRRIKLIFRNAVTYTRIVIAILFAVIIGSLFSELENDLIGSLSRTGYLFLNCFLVLMLSAAITIPSTFRDRVTLFKHRSAEFYSGQSAYLTQIFLDIPLSILEAVLLASISYSWVDMKGGANHFFNFLGVLIGLEFAGQAFGRFLCAVCRKQVTANSLSSVIILFFGTVAGFMPNYGAIPWIFRWMSWVTPASYAFESIMLNEFSGRDINLAVLPAPDGTVSVGRLSGEDWLGTFSLPRSEWNSQEQIKIFDLFFLFILAIVYDLLGCRYVEQTRDWFFNQTRRPQRTAKSADFQFHDKMKMPLVQASEDVEMDETSLKHWPRSLAIENLSYFVPLKKKAGPKRISLEGLLGPILVRLARKQKGDWSQSLREESTNELQLLRDIKGRFMSGRMTALMGTSGAGKSTLLDVIAGYKTSGRISGDTLIEGAEKEAKVWKNISGYAEQQDIINPYLSTIETLRFTAACRLGSSDRAEAVEDVIRLMNLEEYRDIVVGKEADAEGLPKHARKRLTIAIELVTKPKILFCDEPTTGLSTQAANLVVSALRAVTDELQLICVCTIHQPSKLIWDSFNDLLLLVKGGRLAYMGDIGDSVSYFSALSDRIPPTQVNPADFVLSVVESTPIDDIVSAFQQSTILKSIESTIGNDKVSAKTQVHESMRNALEKIEQGKSTAKEMILLANRHFLTQWRNPSYSFMRLSSSVGVSLYMGILFHSDKTVIEGAVLSIGAIFFFVFVLVIPMQATVVPLIEDRAVLYREATSGLYSRLSYGVGQVLADIPFHALNALLMFVCFYYTVEFRREVDVIGYFILMMFLANWVVMSVGQLFAFASPNEESANGLSGLAVILSVILMGFLITVSAMPDYWTWAYWANLYHYIIQGLVTNELAGKIFRLDLFQPNTFQENASNVTSATMSFVPEPGLDLSPGSDALQAGAFLNLATLAGPGVNQAVASSGIGALASLIQCMVTNGCLGEDASKGFLQCCIVPRAPCASEFNEAVSSVDIEEILKCFDSSESDQIAESPSELSEEVVEEMSERDRLQLVLCLMRTLLPPSVVEGIKVLLRIFESLFEVVFFVLDIVQNGIDIPGELILFVFGWARFEDGEFDAPYRWFYCLVSVVIFLGGIELFKLLAVTFVVWTKR